MKKYRITKIIFANNIKIALSNEKEAEVVDVELSEELLEDCNDECNIGFK